MEKNSKMRAKKILTAIRFLFLVAFLLVIIDGYSSQSPRSESKGGSSQTLTVQRAQMVKKQLKGRDIVNERVLTVMNTVERHRFVPENLQAHAYADRPLPIGYGQTISQPYIVGLMTQTLQLDEDDRILEIGTGSGYQAAVLAELIHEVYTIEIIDELAESAKARLQNLGYDNVRVKHADGYFGWEEYAPFDAIIVTAAANHIPPPLLQQLKDGGKLIIPLSSTLRFQTLTLVSRKDGEVEIEFITGVRFVPLTGKALQR